MLNEITSALISVIVCSVNEALFEDFSISLDKTIGVSYELIRIDNNVEKLSITKAYNCGAQKAKFEFLVFVHEDVIFHTMEWGLKLLNYFFSLKDPGVLGVAGSSYLPISPSDWWISNRKYLHANYLSNDKYGAYGKGDLNHFGEQVPLRVFALDGVFLAMKKLVFVEFPFDISLEGFHGYDTSICYRISQKYQNYFVPGILLEHFSSGFPNETWLVNIIHANGSIHSFINQLKSSDQIDKKLEVKSYHLFLNQLKKFSDNYFLSSLYSTFYLYRLLKYFFSMDLIYLWIKFQFANSIKIFRK